MHVPPPGQSPSPRHSQLQSPTRHTSGASHCESYWHALPPPSAGGVCPPHTTGLQAWSMHARPAGQSASAWQASLQTPARQT